MDEKTCDTCKFEMRMEDELPCKDCRLSLLPIDTKYFFAPLLWEAKDEVPSDEVPDQDVVNHPSHYNRGDSMECIEEMIAVFGVEAVKNFCLLNVWKYRYRAGDKNGQEDLKKSDWYMKKFVELTGRG